MASKIISVPYKLESAAKCKRACPVAGKVRDTPTAWPVRALHRLGVLALITA
jgi:hypothetical protein